jgi:hypothetical protein
MTDGGELGMVSENGGLEVPCAPLGDILTRYTNSSQQRIDLWILDVEGHEMEALAGVDFNETHVDVVLVEDVWLTPMPRVLDLFMGRHDFFKLQQLPNDSVFVRRGSAALTAATPITYYPDFDADLELNANWARQPRTRVQLTKAWGFT